MVSWNQVTVVGVGLIGGSLGLALKERGLTRAVVGIGHRETSLAAARRAGAADRTTLDVAEGVRGSDLVVLATPVGLFRSLLEQAAPALEPGAVVIDVGSTKARVVAECEALMPDGRVFLGCHPIAGSEQRGVSFARADLFDGATCVVTPTDRTPEDVLSRVHAMWQAVGMTVRTVSPGEHDRLLAEVSHLPHVAASVLVAAISDAAETLVGPGWADTTRVASGDARLWRDILVSNTSEVARALAGAAGRLDAFRRALERGDAERVEALLAEAKARRDRLTQEKGPR